MTGDLIAWQSKKYRCFERNMLRVRNAVIFHAGGLCRRVVFKAFDCTCAQDMKLENVLSELFQP